MKNQESQTKENKGKFAKAVWKYVRIAPRKVRPVINAIRFKHPVKAFDILSMVNKKAARITEKVLKTAVANARVLGMDEGLLMISDIRADGGPSMKRFMERSMGRGDRIIKRTTHLSIILTENLRQGRVESMEETKAEQKSSPKSIKTAKASKPAKKLAGKA